MSIELKMMVDNGGMQLETGGLSSVQVLKAGEVWMRLV